MHKDLIANLLGVTVKSVYNYEKEDRKIISLLNKYMDDNDANEFLNTNKISKFENIRNKGIDQIRKSEILKLLTKYKTEYLTLLLADSLESSGIFANVSKRLHKAKTKFDFLKEFERILDDLSGEDNTMQSAIDNFNEKIGFDFNKDDKSMVYHIITRYRVYNTLYDLDV